MINIIQEYEKLLNEFIAFKSVSMDAECKLDMIKTADWLFNIFKDRGFKVELIKGPKTNPHIFASYDNNSKETVMVYGHYDVQPAPLSQGWDTDPFMLVKKNGKYFGRGVIDDKGQVLIHMVTIFDLIRSGKLSYNVKFLIEGNEECGNDDMLDILVKYKKEFAFDHLIVSDGEIIKNRPVIEVSLRGGMSIKLVAKTANMDLHSGTFGGAVPNAAVLLMHLISKMISPENVIAVDGFSGLIKKLPEDDIRITEQLASIDKEFDDSTGVKRLTLLNGENFYLKTGLLPTIQVTGFKSGYTSEGFSNIIPAEAEVRLNVRIPYTLKAEDVKKSILKWIDGNADANMDLKIEVSGMHEPIRLNIKSAFTDKVIKCLQAAYGYKPLYKFVGGGVPFVGSIIEIYGKDALMIPLANDDGNMHGPNENFKIELITKSLEFSKRLLGKL